MDGITRAFSTENRNIAALGKTRSLARLFEGRPIEQLRVDQPVFAEGTELDQVVLVLDGALRSVRMLSDGRRAVCRFFYKGDVLDLCPPASQLTSVEAASPCRIARIRRRNIEASVDSNSNLKSQFIELLASEVAASQDHMLLLSCKTAEERICSFLINFIRRNHLAQGRCVRVELPMCRRDIADHLGLTIETISRTFTKLSQRGALRFDRSRGRKTMLIAQLSLIEHLSAEETDEIQHH
ncbi:helix-turn-helix domain-containing protein [Rhizobium helianthi]|uniref:Helix-turn-helix domain-containing protein n=1 Tax=Rhizobium helianthi TaxID=1132695 RepID=A0ABW4M531_9HYPH